MLFIDFVFLLQAETCGFILVVMYSLSNRRHTEHRLNLNTVVEVRVSCQELPLNTHRVRCFGDKSFQATSSTGTDI